MRLVTVFLNQMLHVHCTARTVNNGTKGSPHRLSMYCDTLIDTVHRTLVFVSHPYHSGRWDGNLKKYINPILLLSKGLDLI